MQKLFRIRASFRSSINHTQIKESKPVVSERTINCRIRDFFLTLLFAGKTEEDNKPHNYIPRTESTSINGMERICYREVRFRNKCLIKNKAKITVFRHIKKDLRDQSKLSHLTELLLAVLFYFSQQHS